MNEFLNLLLPWQKTPNDQISDFFVYGIFILFCILLVVFIWKTIRRVRLISSLNNKIGKLCDDYGRPAEPGILNKLEEIFDRSDKFYKPFNKAWQEFKESLIIPERRKVVYKTDEASLFFSEDRLLGQYMNLRFWNSVPSILVGLGILGTFVGLVWGLIPFSDIDFEETSQIQGAIKILLSGVSTAFVTSVWGMLASLSFNWLEKGCINMISRKVADLQGALDLPFTLKTQEEISEKQKDELEQQTTIFKTLFTDLGEDIKSAMREGRQEILHELNRTVEAFSTTILEQLTPILEKLMNAIEELRQQKEESSEEAIKELIEKFQESLSASTVTQMEELAKTVAEASQSLKDLPGQIGKMIASVQEQINQTHQLLNKTSQTQTDKMKNMMDEMIKTLQSVVDIAAKQTGEQLDQQMEKMKNVSDESIQTLQETIAELRESITDTLAQQQAAIDQITSQTVQASTDATHQLSQLIEQITSSLSENVLSADESIKKLLEQQNTQTETFNAQVANSQEILESGQRMLEQMNTSVSNVHQLIDTVKAFSMQLTAGANQLEGAGERLMVAGNTFNEENERFLTANRSTIQQLQNTLEQTQQLLDNSTQRFKTIDEGLQGIFSEIETGLNTYAISSRETITTYLNGFSDQLTQASTALAQSVEALNEVVQEAIDVNEQLSLRRENP